MDNDQFSMYDILLCTKTIEKTMTWTYFSAQKYGKRITVRRERNVVFRRWNESFYNGIDSKIDNSNFFNLPPASCIYNRTCGIAEENGRTVSDFRVLYNRVFNNVK